MSPERKTLARHGERGRTVRVLLDQTRDRTLVQWYEQGKPRKRVFAASREGQAEAKSWAIGFSEELERKARGGPLTMRGLWDAYREVEYASKRPRTQQLYRERWMKWEDFIGKDTDPEAVAMQDIDRFVTRARAVGKSMNQARHVLNVARIVFNWGLSRKYLMATDFSLYRWKQAKDERPLEIGEHAPEEFDRILAVLDPEKPREWRIWALLMIAGSQGPRIRTARHLTWQDVQGDVIRWPAAMMKQGEDFLQPITADTRLALEQARAWRLKDKYTGPYVFYPGRKDNTQGVYTYQSAWLAFRKAEKRAGVSHIPFRAFHGLRRMAAGNVYDALKDPLAAAEWIGDRDVKQMRSYLKRRADRLEAARDASERRR